MTTNEAFDTLVTERAKRTAFGMGGLPTTVDELAGMLAGFATGVRRDMTDDMLKGYIDAKTPKPLTADEVAHIERQRNPAEFQGVKLVTGRKAKTPKPALPTVLENSHVRVEYRERGISGDDKRDKFNLPRFFTTNKRGLDRQWAALVGAFSTETTYSGAMSGLRAAGAKVHDYCSMD